jgi:hypothetical protein
MATKQKEATKERDEDQHHRSTAKNGDKPAPEARSQSDRQDQGGNAVDLDEIIQEQVGKAVQPVVQQMQEQVSKALQQQVDQALEQVRSELQRQVEPSIQAMLVGPGNRKSRRAR